MWKTTAYKIIFILLLTVLFAAGCGDDSDGNPPVNLDFAEGDAPPDLPENTDAPRIAYAYWAPDPAEELSAGLSTRLGSLLLWSVCDRNDDLPGGGIYIYKAQTNELLTSGPVYWEDFSAPVSGVSDCSAAIQVGIQLSFDDTPGLEKELCVDLEVTDGEGNASNRLNDVCLYVP